MLPLDYCKTFFFSYDESILFYVSYLDLFFFLGGAHKNYGSGGHDVPEPDGFLYVSGNMVWV